MNARNGAISDADMKAHFERIMSLPQGCVLDPRDVESWIAGMCSAESSMSHAIDWHINRARAIGSSEAVVAWCEKNSIRPPFQASARKIAEQRLFKRLPEPMNSHMERGTRLEPLLREMFRSGYWNGSRSAKVAEVVPLDAELEALRKFNFPIGHKYQIVGGEPDDYVSIGGRRYIVDYKSPVEVEQPGSREDLDMLYGGQLSWLKLKAQTGLGLRVDGLILAKLDFVNWTIVPMSVEESESFTCEIFEANRKLWEEYIMRGRLPEPFAPRAFELSPSLASSLEPEAERILLAQVMSDAWYQETNELKKNFGEHFKTGDVDAAIAAKYTIAGLRVSFRKDVDKVAVTDWFRVRSLRMPQKMELDEARLARALRQANIDINLDDFRKASNDIDWDQALDEIRRAGEDERAFYQASPRIYPSREKNWQEQIAQLRHQARKDVSRMSKKFLPGRKPSPEAALPEAE